MEDDILRIVKEDLLEVLGKGGKVSVSSIEPEIKVPPSFILEAIKELERENLIKAEGNLIFLTEGGSKKAENIIKKHSVIENYFKKTRSKEEAWKAASVLEHYISEGVIDNIKKLSALKKEGVPLTELKQEKGLITNLIFEARLFERVISMGISPGERIKITNKLPNSIIVEIENKKFALDEDIAKGIRVLNVEQVLI